MMTNILIHYYDFDQKFKGAMALGFKLRNVKFLFA